MQRANPHLLVVGHYDPLFSVALDAALRRITTGQPRVTMVTTHAELEQALDQPCTASLVALDTMPVIGRTERDQHADRRDILRALEGHGPVLVIEGRNTALSAGLREQERYSQGKEYVLRFQKPVAAYTVVEALVKTGYWPQR